MKEEVIRQEITSAAKVIFQRQGYLSVTMGDIAKAAGKGRSTLYYYFSQKQDIFDAVIQEETLSVLRAAAKTVSKGQAFNDNLLSYNRSKLEGLRLKIKLYPSLLADIRENPGLITQTRKLLNQEQKGVFMQLLFWGVMNRDIAEMEAKDIDYLAGTLVTALSSLEQEVFFYGKAEDLINRLSWLVSILAKGLR